MLTYFIVKHYTLVECIYMNICVKTDDFLKFKLWFLIFLKFKLQNPSLAKPIKINKNAIAKLAIISNLPKSATILGKCNPLVCT